MGFNAKANATRSLAWGGLIGCSADGGNCNNTRENVFAIYGGLCVSNETGPCPALGGGDVFINGNVNISGNLTIGGNISFGDIFINNILAAGGWNKTNGFVILFDPVDKVGIGTSNPSAKLDVEVTSGGAATIGSAENLATGDHSVAMGQNADALGNQAIALGQGVTASGSQSIAMGQNTLASGRQSTAMGQDTIASGIQSTAMGDNTLAEGTESTAMGDESRALGDQSLATGQSTTAAGLQAVSMGLNSKATADNSFAWGGDKCTTLDGTDCNNTRSGVFAIYGGLCVGDGAPCPDIPDGSAYINGTVNITSISGNVGKVVCIKLDGTLGTCTSNIDGSGGCTCA